MTLILRPVSFRDAKAFVATHHRHNKPPVGMKFCVGISLGGGDLVGVGIAGRPVARHFDNGVTVEITRTCTDGTANANSMLLGALRQAAWALGYRRVITYTQCCESGASMRAAGFVKVAERRPRSGWDTPSRPRQSHGADHVDRVLWEVVRHG